jgi:GNAT superfamily N-acetyltransferase
MAMRANLSTHVPKCDRPGRDLIIRDCRPEEADALGELTVRVYTAIGATEGGSYVDQLRDVRGRMETCTVLVAVDDDGMLLGGTAYVPGPGGPWADISRDGEAEFRMLVVDQGHQGRGVGESLVKACIGLAKAQERERLVLLSNHMMTPAHRLYERLGFVRAPDRDWFISEDVDLRCYVLDL